MDLRNFKEICINQYTNIYNMFIHSSFFYIVKERYNHLSILHRKIFHGIMWLSLLVSIFYYPVSYFYSSLRHIKNFNTKQALTRELIELSTATESHILKSYSNNQGAIVFIKNKIKTLNIPTAQIKNIKEATIDSQKFSFPANINSVEVELSNLNVKQIVQYGQQLESLSNNIKLTNITIEENKNNYFNTSYILSFFSLSKATNGKSKKQKINKKKPVINFQKLSKKPHSANTNNTPNKKLKNIKLPNNKLQNSKIPNGKIPNSKLPNNKLQKSKIPIGKSKKQKINKKKPVINFQKLSKKNEFPLLNLKQKDLDSTDTYFKNQPTRVKKTDSIPSPPIMNLKTNSLLKKLDSQNKFKTETK